jgi:CheY-like chemotaxis protein
MNSSISVLVAEDEESDFLLLERALKNSDERLKIYRVRDGVEGMEYIKGEGEFADRVRFPLPQMLILDLKMPRMTGMEFLAWLRSEPSRRIIPTLMMSSSEQAADVRQAYELGANTYFLKPSDFKSLVELCKRISAYWSHGIKPPIG